MANLYQSYFSLHRNILSTLIKMSSKHKNILICLHHSYFDTSDKPSRISVWGTDLMKLNRFKLGFTICKFTCFLCSCLEISFFGQVGWFSRWRCVHSAATTVRNGTPGTHGKVKKRDNSANSPSALHTYAILHDSHVGPSYMHTYNKK